MKLICVLARLRLVLFSTRKKDQGICSEKQSSVCSLGAWKIGVPQVHEAALGTSERFLSKSYSRKTLVQ